MTQGDIVRCVDNKGCWGLILDETYPITMSKGNYITVKTEKGIRTVAKRRFIIA